jgi:hypothetical protein
MHFYERPQGDDDWTDFIEWLYFFNSTSDEDFFNNLTEHVEVTSLLRSLVVESFVISNDNIASGNNFYVYHQTKNAPPDQMVIFPYDFDDVFEIEKKTKQLKGNTDILSFFLDEPAAVDFEEYNPLLNRMLAVQTWEARYLEYYRTFITSVFGSASVQQPTERYVALLQFVLPWVARDALRRICYGVEVDEFITDAEVTASLLSQRFQDVYAQLTEING